ncbi:MAG: erythromycin esterase family protein [Bacteroidetes bacterium]|nr:erythromycin esterase family protein [Bacteroidota bacterium]
MKNLILLSLLLLVSGVGHSQVTVHIGKCDEKVYLVAPNETNSLDELLPVENLVKEKVIIGMGEATHGTKEFFNMKAKMFKFLATHCGFKVFAIEATYGGTLEINDYVLYGKGDVLSAMKGMEFWTWDTEEVKELIEWMKRYNHEKPEGEKLKFYGFDCQSFKGPGNALADYVRKADPDHLDEFTRGLSVLNDSSYLYFYTLNDTKSKKKEIAAMHEIISFADNWFKQKRDTYISRSNKERYELAFHNIENLRQALMLKEKPRFNYFYLRDSCMAQNIRWIHEFENANVFAWAHNGHICKWSPYSSAKFRSMGSYLNDLFGEGYYNIGFVFSEGNFQAYDWPTAKIKKGLQEFTVPVNKKNTLTTTLSQPGMSSFLIDLDSSENTLFSTSQRYYNIGAVYMVDKRSSQKMVAKKQYDALIFVNKTTRAIPVKREVSKTGT